MSSTNERILLELHGAPSYKFFLQIVKDSQEGLGWTCSEYMAKDIIKDFSLKLTQRRTGDITGSTSALFEYEGETLRLQKYLGRYKLYHGEWKSDPRWTGD